MVWLTTFFKKIFHKKPQRIPRDQHIISRKNISRNALKVLYRLKEQGYKAYLVGGGVRDLLLSLHPKDFDIATDALPTEVRRLFKNCRLIGRRFRLAHICFGEEIIEVATFRKTPAGREAIHRNMDGKVVRDNVYGTQKDDVMRRDFTINALYYDIYDFSVVDYVGGTRDLQQKILRLIGVPSLRYKEDPVRMLRAIRFMCKLNFTLETNTALAIKKYAQHLQFVAPARLFDEYVKLFTKGYAAAVFAGLERYDLLAHFLPAAVDLPAEYKYFVQNSLQDIDAQYKAGEELNPALPLAIMLWPKVADKINMARKTRIADIVQMGRLVIHEQKKIIMLSNKVTHDLIAIWCMQGIFAEYDIEALSAYASEQIILAYRFLLLLACSNIKGAKRVAGAWHRLLGTADVDYGENLINLYQEFFGKNNQKSHD